jgi:nitric oxide synthase oxygenase domain/subunit
MSPSSNHYCCYCCALHQRDSEQTLLWLLHTANVHQLLLITGARVAWRNSAKCIGRIAWNTLLVRDRRNVTDPDEMMAECFEHQRLATSDGSLKAVMTVFRPQKPNERLGVRFWNVQLVC